MKPREWSWFNRIFFAVFILVLVGVIAFLAWRQSIASEERAQLIDALTQSQAQLRDEGIEPERSNPSKSCKTLLALLGAAAMPDPVACPERTARMARLALRVLLANRVSKDQPALRATLGLRARKVFPAPQGRKENRARSVRSGRRVQSVPLAPHAPMAIRLAPSGCWSRITKSTSPHLSRQSSACPFQKEQHHEDPL